MFIKENRKQFGISLSCKILGISRSSYHRWLNRKVSQRRDEELKLVELIKYYYSLGRGNYGLPRITASLRKSGIIVNKKRVARLMRINKIKAKTRRRFKKTTVQSTRREFNKNLLNQNFISSNKDKIWTSDITYLWTKEGWLYLCVVMDIYSRKIIGWSIDKNMSGELVKRAVEMAIVQRGSGKAVIFHSDRGSQYTSSAVREVLKNNEMVQSMSSTGNCYDNAVTESFFHTLKTELIYWNHYSTREEAKKSVFEYIEVFYNRVRLHSSIGYLSPVELEEKNNRIINKKVA
jgi:transposase InsO family protein